MISEADELELPLAVADSLNELAKMCGKMKPADIARIIRYKRKTKSFHGIPARIYKINDGDSDILGVRCDCEGENGK